MATIIHPQAYIEARESYIRLNARTTFFRNFERAEEVEIFLDGILQSDKIMSGESFLSSVARKYESMPKLSEKQYNAICKIIDDRNAKKAERIAKAKAEAANSSWVGVVGERQQFELTVVAVVEYEKPRFHYHDSGFGYLTIMADAAGNRVVYFNSLEAKSVDEDGCVEYTLAEKGDQVVFMAKVKEHGERDGAKQTIVQRPTKIKVTKAAQ